MGGGERISAVDLTTFLQDWSAHIVTGADPTLRWIDLGCPWLPIESTGSRTSLDGYMDWRAEVRVLALDAPRKAPEVVVGAVEFLILQAGYESPREALPLYGARAAAFVTAGMPISTVLIVLDAWVDGRLPPGPPLRAWSVAQTIHTMMSTTAGLVLMPALAGVGIPRHRLVAATDLDPDWRRVGCASVAGHPAILPSCSSRRHLMRWSPCAMRRCESCCRTD